MLIEGTRRDMGERKRIQMDRKDLNFAYESLHAVANVGLMHARHYI